MGNTLRRALNSEGEGLGLRDVERVERVPDEAPKKSAVGVVGSRSAMEPLRSYLRERHDVDDWQFGQLVPGIPNVYQLKLAAQPGGLCVVQQTLWCHELGPPWVVRAGSLRSWTRETYAAAPAESPLRNARLGSKRDGGGACGYSDGPVAVPDATWIIPKGGSRGAIAQVRLFDPLRRSGPDGV